MESKNHNLQLILGLDIFVPELELFVHQPTLTELGMTMMSTREINQIVGILTIDGENLDEGVKISNFEAFMLVYDSLKGALKNNLFLILDLLFPNCVFSFVPKRTIYISVPIGETKKTVMVEENNFNYLQESIKEIFCIDMNKSEEPEYNTKSKRAEELKRKILEGRKELAKRKAKQMDNNDDTLVKYISVVSVSTGISFNEIKNFTMYQLYDILNRYNLWFAYDLDLKIRLAGGEIKQEAEQWTKNIH